MRNNFLGKEEVLAYLSDFLNRLENFKNFPTLWCPVTPSGNELLESFLDLISERHPQLIAKIQVLPIHISETSGAVKFEGKTPTKDIAGKNVLVFDSVIHSGSTMADAVSKVMDFGAKTVCTYALVVKRGSRFIPTIWGLMIDDTDRVFLLLDEIPNQRLHAGHYEIQPVHIEQLNTRHLETPVLKSGLKSMDRITWGDRYFDMKASEQGRISYVLQIGNRIVGYLTIHQTANGCMVVDEIAVAKNQSGKGYGSILIRFAHTLARQTNCLYVRLFAIKKEVQFYERNNYKSVDGKLICVDGEEYNLMERTIIHSANCSFL